MLIEITLYAFVFFLASFFIGNELQLFKKEERLKSGLLFFLALLSMLFFVCHLYTPGYVSIGPVVNSSFVFVESWSYKVSFTSQTALFFSLLCLNAFLFYYLYRNSLSVKDLRIFLISLAFLAVTFSSDSFILFLIFYFSVFLICLDETSFTLRKLVFFAIAIWSVCHVGVAAKSFLFKDMAQTLLNDPSLSFVFTVFLLTQFFISYFLMETTKTINRIWVSCYVMPLVLLHFSSLLSLDKVNVLYFIESIYLVITFYLFSNVLHQKKYKNSIKKLSFEIQFFYIICLLANIDGTLNGPMYLLFMPVLFTFISPRLLLLKKKSVEELISSKSKIDYIGFTLSLISMMVKFIFALIIFASLDNSSISFWIVFLALSLFYLGVNSYSFSRVKLKAPKKIMDSCTESWTAILLVVLSVVFVPLSVSFNTIYSVDLWILVATTLLGLSLILFMLYTVRAHVDSGKTFKLFAFSQKNPEQKKPVYLRNYDRFINFDFLGILVGFVGKVLVLFEGLFVKRDNFKSRELEWEVLVFLSGVLGFFIILKGYLWQIL